MCPNLGVERNLLPECRIANRVIMYSVLYSMLVAERPDEEVEEDLRDRYDVFRQVLHNFPVPLHIRVDDNLDYVLYNALEQQHLRQQLRLFDVPSNTSMGNNASKSSPSQTSIVSSGSGSSDLSVHCDFYDNALRSRLSQLRRAGVSGAGGEAAQLMDCKEDEHSLDSGDETN